MSLQHPRAGTALAAALAVTSLAVPASAATSTSATAPVTHMDQDRHRGCVSRSEYRRIRHGQTKSRVEHHVAHVKGDPNPWVPRNANTWAYAACKPGFWVEVDYSNMNRGKPYRVRHKAWAQQEGGRAARDCLSRGESRRLHQGMPIRRVHRIIGYPGRKVFDHGGGMVRRYVRCHTHGKTQDMYYVYLRHGFVLTDKNFRGGSVARGPVVAVRERFPAL